MNKYKTFLSAARAILFVALASTAIDAQVYGGRGVGASATVTSGGSSTNYVFADTGQLPVNGGNITISAPSSTIVGSLSTGVLTASTSGALRSSQSVTIVNDVDINIGGVRVRANRVTVNAGCICCPGVQIGTCLASTTINGLTVTDLQGVQTAVNATGQPNQVVQLPGGVGTLTLNEQVAADGSINVSGIRVDGAANGSTFTMVIASAASFLECLVTNPTPADVRISGRVLTSSGAGVSRATVTLTDSSGNVRTTLTNTFGSYQFDGVEAGGTYILQASYRSYSFNAVAVTPDDDVTVDIVAK